MKKHLFAVLLWFVTPPLLAAQSGVVEFKLDNGMKVIVKTDHRAPVVTSQVWYKVGSSYEQPGTTGVSHVLEHMMFKGTKTVKPDEFSRIIAALGGSENAFTGVDYTAYFETLANAHLARALELEADRMSNLLLDPKEFQRELAVVREERRLRTDDSPNGRLYEQFNAVAWRISPYRNPVIGWMHDLETLTVDDLRRWYQRWYAPANAILVVVGDVKPKEVLKLAQKSFGALPKRKLTPPEDLPEIAQAGLTRVNLEIPAQQPVLLMGYKVPGKADAARAWEPYALQVLASLLGGGDSARFSANLVRGQKLAVTADASYDAFSRLPGMLELEASPAPGVTLEQLEAGLKQELKKLQDDPVSKEELQRVIRQTLAEKVYARDSMFYQAMLIGMREANGYSWRTLDEELKNMQKVTAGQIQQVARDYLRDAYLTVAMLKPLKQKNQQKNARGKR